MIRLGAYLAAFCLTSFSAVAEEVQVDSTATDVTVAPVDPYTVTDTAKDAAPSGGLPQFDPTWFASQVFWLVVFFAFLYVFFGRKTLPEIGGVIQNRKDTIDADLKMAEALSAESDAVKSDYEKGLQAAHEDAAKAIAMIEDTMKRRAAIQTDEFRARSETEMADAETRIAGAKDKAMQDMGTVAAEIASMAVQKIIGVGTDVAQAKAIIKSLNDKAKAA